MCFTPLHIPNKSRSFKNTESYRFLTVPCGKCLSCRGQSQDDWYIRAFFEYRRCQKVGGLTWFPTFTYNNDNLPIWKVGDIMQFPCFSYEHIKHLRNAFRVNLKRYFFNQVIENWKIKNIPDYVPINKISFVNDTELAKYRRKFRVPREIRKRINHDCDEKIQGIRFIVCSEFGSDYGRPHYHALFFIPFFIKFADLKSLLEKSWPFGHVSWPKDNQQKYNKPLRPYIESSRGIKYVMKYITKDDFWSEKYNIPMVKELYEDYGDKELLLQFKRSCPRHYQSTNFGIDGLDMFVTADGEIKIDMLSEGKLNPYEMGFSVDSKKTESYYRIPSYYYRKFCYDYDKENELFQINDVGRAVKVASFQRRFNYLCDYYNDWFETYHHFASALFSVPIFSLAPKNSVLNLFDTKQEIYDTISRLLNGRSMADLALYSVLYSGLGCKDYYALLEKSPSEQIDILASPEYVANILGDLISPKNDVLYEKGDSEYILDKTFSWKHVTFGDLDCFKDFDFILNILYDIERIIGIQKQKALHSKNDVKSRQHFYINLFNYGHG